MGHAGGFRKDRAQAGGRESAAEILEQEAKSGGDGPVAGQTPRVRARGGEAGSGPLAGLESGEDRKRFPLENRRAGGVGKVDAEVQLDVLLAAAQRKEPAVVELLRTLEQGDAAGDPLLAFRACLEGGDVEKGKRLFFEHEATRCTRCHTQNGKGGNAGPVLDGIGSRQTRQYLLAALVTPSAQIADGFATTVLQLHNGDLLSGIVTKDQDGMVEITGLDGETKKVEQNRIAERRTASDSAMPPMGGTLDRRQLRDVIAFLASLQTAPK